MILKDTTQQKMFNPLHNKLVYISTRQQIEYEVCGAITKIIDKYKNNIRRKIFYSVAPSIANNIRDQLEERINSRVGSPIVNAMWHQTKGYMT